MLARPRALAPLLAPAAVLLTALVLHAISPWRQGGPISQLWVGQDWATSSAFDARALTCVTAELTGERSDAFRLRASCGVAIAGAELRVEVQHQGIPGACAASYRGEALPCTSAIPFYNASLPAVLVTSDLGLSPAELRALPGTNPLFAVEERVWFWSQVGWAGIIAAATVGLFTSGARIRGRASLGRRVARWAGYLASGAALAGVVWYALLFALLFSGLVD